MKQNTIITLGLGAIVYYLWSRGNKPNTNEVIHQTKPMYLEDGAKPFLEEGRPLLPSELPLQNSINLPNLGIPWKDRVPTSDFSNIGGHNTKKGKKCTVEITTNNTSYKCKGRFVNGVCQPCAGNVVNYATDPNWEAQSVFSILR